METEEFEGITDKIQNNDELLFSVRDYSVKAFSASWLIMSFAMLLFLFIVNGRNSHIIFLIVISIYALSSYSFAKKRGAVILFKSHNCKKR